MTLPDRLAAAMHRLAPAWRGRPGVVAVSGGADSVALLTLLAPLSPGGRGVGGEGDRNLVVAHVNHLLRGAESDADEGFVIELAARLGCEVRTARIPVPPGNVENEARKARYELVRSVAEEVGAGWIATAHTLDDQAETVLHRLIRGTGIQGLRGIRSGESGGTAVPLLRPLLDIRRAELREYLASIQQPFREDSSNLDPRFTRNRIRHELLPMLETFNPRIAEALNRLSQQATEHYEFAEGEADYFLADAELPKAGDAIVFDASTLEMFGPALRRAVLRMAWQREGWPLLGMTFAHWARLAELGTADYPGGVRARRTGNVFQLRSS